MGDRCHALHPCPPHHGLSCWSTAIRSQRYLTEFIAKKPRFDELEWLANTALDSNFQTKICNILASRSSFPGLKALKQTNGKKTS